MMYLVENGYYTIFTTNYPNSGPCLLKIIDFGGI